MLDWYTPLTATALTTSVWLLLPSRLDAFYNVMVIIHNFVVADSSSVFTKLELEVSEINGYLLVYYNYKFQLLHMHVIDKLQVAWTILSSLIIATKQTVWKPGNL
jgi:hypothetical protein